MFSPEEIGTGPNTPVDQQDITDMSLVQAAIGDGEIIYSHVNQLSGDTTVYVDGPDEDYSIDREYVISSDLSSIQAYATAKRHNQPRKLLGEIVLGENGLSGSIDTDYNLENGDELKINDGVMDLTITDTMESWAMLSGDEQEVHTEQDITTLNGNISISGDIKNGNLSLEYSDLEGTQTSDSNPESTMSFSIDHILENSEGTTAFGTEVSMTSEDGKGINRGTIDEFGFSEDSTYINNYNVDFGADGILEIENLNARMQSDSLIEAALLGIDDLDADIDITIEDGVAKFIISVDTNGDGTEEVLITADKLDLKTLLEGSGEDGLLDSLLLTPPSMRESDKY